jgi:hypothetical protein
VNICPAIVKVPVLVREEVFALAVQVTVPLPLPLAGVKVSQEGSLLETDQTQFVFEVTVTGVVPPVEVKLALRGEIE